jgi:hypothetical protein
MVQQLKIYQRKRFKMMNDQSRQIENDPLTADESESTQDTTES